MQCIDMKQLQQFQHTVHGLITQLLILCIHHHIVGHILYYEQQMLIDADLKDTAGLLWLSQHLIACRNHLAVLCDRLCLFTEKLQCLLRLSAGNQIGYFQRNRILYQTVFLTFRNHAVTQLLTALHNQFWFFMQHVVIEIKPCHLEQEGKAGVIFAYQLLTVSIRIGAVPAPFSTELQIQLVYSLHTQLRFISDQLIHTDIKQSGQLGQQQDIRQGRFGFPLGNTGFRYPHIGSQLFLRHVRVSSQRDKLFSKSNRRHCSFLLSAFIISFPRRVTMA